MTALRQIPTRALCLGAAGAILAAASNAQTLRVGVDYPFTGNVNPAVVQTIVNVYGGAANVSGNATTATFGWSATGCPAAAVIKFFRPAPSQAPDRLVFLAERGPFDVTNPLQPAGTVPPATQTVALVPPVALQKGDVVGITNVTTCGGPTWSLYPGPYPLLPPAAWVLPGNVRTDVTNASATASSYFVAVHAEGPAAGLSLLGGRFEATLSATDPRTGATTAGTPNRVSDAAGYFGLPGFTADPAFPEVIVKMVDATSAQPPFGGAFWFFHSSLTDVSYTLTVTDTRTGRTRTYGNAGSPAFCGGADTNAFPP